MRTFDLRVMKDRRHLTSALLQHDDHALAISRWLHTYSLLVHQTIEAERVPGLQVVGLLSQKKKKSGQPHWTACVDPTVVCNLKRQTNTHLSEGQDQHHHILSTTGCTLST